VRHWSAGLSSNAAVQNFSVHLIGASSAELSPLVFLRSFILCANSDYSFTSWYQIGQHLLLFGGASDSPLGYPLLTRLYQSMGYDTFGTQAGSP
jgi:hypothetical protein